MMASKAVTIPRPSSPWPVSTMGEFDRKKSICSETGDDQMFLFDEDMRLGSSGGILPQMKDLIISTDFNKEEEQDCFIQESFSLPKPGSLLRYRQFYHLYGKSPDIASSVDSEVGTIEGLRDHLQSCFTCGVLWRENQASLDCDECDGYALTRPCMNCNGTCGALWKRDIELSHLINKAKWIGACKLRNCSIEIETDSSSTSSCGSANN